MVDLIEENTSLIFKKLQGCLNDATLEEIEDTLEAIRILSDAKTNEINRLGKLITEDETNKANLTISDASNSTSKKETGQYMIFITLIIGILNAITWFTFGNTDIILIINSLVLITLTSSIRFNQ